MFFGLGVIIASRRRALVFGEDGTLALIRPSRTGCTILGKQRIAKGGQIHPAMADGRLFVRDRKFFYCYQFGLVKTAAPAGTPAAGKKTASAR
jgi:hypothetical protein